MALGAFLAGMVVGRSEYSLRRHQKRCRCVTPLRCCSSRLGGMLLDPAALVCVAVAGAWCAGCGAGGKPLVAFVLVYAMRYPFKSALTVAVALAQIGEFSFILATIGRELGDVTSDATNALVATSIASIILNPPACG